MVDVENTPLLESRHSNIPTMTHALEGSTATATPRLLFDAAAAVVAHKHTSNPCQHIVAAHALHHPGNNPDAPIGWCSSRGRRCAPAF